MANSVYLNTLLSVITPQMVAAEYALPDSVSEEDGTIYCEFKNTGPLRIHAGGFVAVDFASSPMKAGSIIDVLAVRQPRSHGVVSYREAVGSLVYKFESVLPAGMRDEAVRDYVAREAYVKRRIFNAAVCGSTDTDSIPHNLLVMLGNDYAGIVRTGCMNYLGRERMRVLKERLHEAGYNTDFFKAESPALVVPYFSSACEIACIELIYAANGAKNDVIWLTGHHVGMSCLLLAKETDEFFLETNTGLALQDVRDSMETKAAFFSVLIQPEGTEIGWLPKRFCFVDRNMPMSLLVPAVLVKSGSKCIVTQYPSIQGTATAGSVQWGEAVASAVIDELKEKHEFTPKIKFLLESVRADRNVKLIVKSYLQNNNEFWLSNILDSLLRDGVIWQSDSGSVFSTAAGYVYETPKNKDLGGDPVTNFTIIPRYSIMYETGDMFYACQVDVRGELREVVLSSSCMDHTRKLVEGIQKCIALSGFPVRINPVMFDPARGRILIPYLQKQFAELPVRQGITFLGWNGTRTAFLGPDFRCESDVEHKPNIFKPGVDYLRYFDIRDEATPISNSLADVPDELLTVIKQCAGIIVRSYSNHIVSPVPYANTRETRDSLQMLFAQVGQKRALQLNQNMRNATALDCLSGYPYLAIGYNRNQAKAVRSGMILLGEEGPSVVQFSQMQYEAAGRLLRFVFEKLPASLIANCGPNTVPDTKEVSPDQLALEGWNELQRIL